MLLDLDCSFLKVVNFQEFQKNGKSLESFFLKLFILECEKQNKMEGYKDTFLHAGLWKGFYYVVEKISPPQLILQLAKTTEWSAKVKKAKAITF